LQKERYGNGNNDSNSGGIATVHAILIYSILHSMFLINNYVRFSIKLGINHSKIVRSSEGNLIGNVDAVDGTSTLVLTEGGRTRYKIPKYIVQGFDGHQVSLNIQKAELERFKGAEAEGFREVK
jgi:hypothetical protein